MTEQAGDSPDQGRDDQGNIDGGNADQSSAGQSGEQAVPSGESAAGAGQPGSSQAGGRRDETGPGRGTSGTEQDRRRQASAGSSPRTGSSPRPSRSRQSNPASDMMNDFQRWLLRNSAKSVGREISGQVKRTLGGGRTESSDVWDTATTEIPPEVGESPECQWCPICRAARRVRDSNPALGDQLSTAGDVVATAVQEAMRTFESVVSRASGSTASRPAPRDTWAASSDDWAAARDSWAEAHGARGAGHQDSSAHEDSSAQQASAGEADSAPEVNHRPDGSDEPDHRG